MKNLIGMIEEMKSFHLKCNANIAELIYYK